MATFAEMMATERERLNTALSEVADKIAALNEEAAGYRRELSAIDAYERAKTGTSNGARTGNGTRSPRGAKQETLFSLIQGSGDGMTRAQILEAVGVKGDKKAEGSISNALTNMKKAGKIGLNDGIYRAA